MQHDKDICRAGAIAILEARAPRLALGGTRVALDDSGTFRTEADLHLQSRSAVGKITRRICVIL